VLVATDAGTGVVRASGAIVRVFDVGAKDGPEVVRDRVFTVANVLSFARLAALPVIYLDLVSGRWLRAFVLLAVFSATDWLDGYLARRLDQVTRLGKLLDPISDRLLFVVVGVGFVVADILPLWAVLVLVVRDVIVLTGGLVLLSRGVRPPDVSKLGKAATFGLMWALPLFLLARVFAGDAGDPQPVLEALAWFTYLANAALYWLGLVDYVRTIRRGTPAPPPGV
jgi:cardiolipin synthase (CMP-forming)